MDMFEVRNDMFDKQLSGVMVNCISLKHKNLCNSYKDQ